MELDDRDVAMTERLGDWWPILKVEFDKQYMVKLANEISALRSSRNIFPLSDDVFRAFKMTPPQKTKVIILGQDPYHDGINATGLAFECGGRKSRQRHDVTPSWDKMLRGYDEQYPTSFATDLYEGDLTRWAEHGVLLLNSALTVEKGKPGSHAMVWQPFMVELMKILGTSQRPKVFIFLGRQAQAFQKFVKTPHFSIYREHPAAACYAERRWEHGDCFKVANDFLRQTGQEPIDW
jgi:uracil-DNA glycosylase